MLSANSTPQSKNIYWNSDFYQLDAMTTDQLEDLFDQIVDVAADITDAKFRAESHRALEAVNQELDFRNAEPAHLAWLALIYDRPTCLFPTCANPIDPNKDAFCAFHSEQAANWWPAPSFNKVIASLQQNNGRSLN